MVATPSRTIPAEPTTARKVVNRGSHMETIPYPAAKGLPAEVPPGAASARRRKQLVQLADNECRFPHGTPGQDDFLFCAELKREGLPYCAFHCRIAYQPVARREPGARPA